MAKFNDEIDFKALDKEVANAIARDEKYQRENDAKFRAINQKVQSYEEFRDIVDASHLTSLDKGDKLGGMAYQRWNAHSSNPLPAAGLSKNQDAEENQKADIKQPSSSHEFTKTWKRQCATFAEKYSYLLNIEAEVLLKCFAVECPLDEMLLCMKENCKIQDINKLIFILKTVGKCKRFSLLLDFLSKDEQNNLSEIFNTIREWIKDEVFINNQSDFEELVKTYKL